MRIEKISHGLTFKGIVSTIGLILLIAGLAIIFNGIKSNNPYSIIILISGICIVIPGFILFISVRGVLIDFENKLIKAYLDIFILKIGKWESLAHYNKIVLKYTNESQTLSSRGNSTNFKTRSIDIVLISDMKKELIIMEFIDYNEAKSFLTLYSTRLNKEAVDGYEILKQRIEERKQYVRR